MQESISLIMDNTSVITFIEHSSKSIQDDLKWDLNDPRLDLLERLNIQNRDTLFAVGRKTIKASQYVGLVRLGNTTLQVLPKISYHGDFDKPIESPEYKSAVNSAMHNLLVMLSIACDLPLRALDSAHLYNEEGDWLEILTRLFTLELHRQFQAGLSHAYITVEDRLPVIRGRWLVGQQLARHSFDRTRFDVAYDEFSSDILLNQIFRLTVDSLLHLTQDSTNRRLLLDLREWLSLCNPHKETLAIDLKNVQFSRLNERFHPAFNIATLFWQHQLVQLSSGDKSAFAFVFDMNILFQDFIAQFLQRLHKQILPEEWLESQINLQSQGQKVYFVQRMNGVEPPGQPVFRLIPDILIKDHSGSPLVIVDTKYKKLSLSAKDRGVAEGDAYQMLAYAQSWKCSKVIMFYPSSNLMTNHYTFYLNDENKTKIHAIELNLQRPLEDSQELINELKLAFQSAL